MSSARDKSKVDQGIPFEATQKKAVNEKLDAAVFGERVERKSSKVDVSVQGDKDDPGFAAKTRHQSDAQHRDFYNWFGIVLSIVALVASGFAIYQVEVNAKERNALRIQIDQIKQDFDSIKNSKSNSDSQARLSALENQIGRLERLQSLSSVSLDAFQNLKDDVERVKKNDSNLSDDEDRLSNLEKRVKKLENN